MFSRGGSEVFSDAAGASAATGASGVSRSCGATDGSRFPAGVGCPATSGVAAGYVAAPEAGGVGSGCGAGVCGADGVGESLAFPPQSFLIREKKPMATSLRAEMKNLHAACALPPPRPSMVPQGPPDVQPATGHCYWTMILAALDWAMETSRYEDLG